MYDSLSPTFHPSFGQIGDKKCGRTDIETGFIRSSRRDDLKTEILNGITKRQDTISKYLKALSTLTAVSEKTLEMAHMNKDSESSERSAFKRD